MGKCIKKASKHMRSSSRRRKGRHAERQRGQRVNYKPWPGESTLSSQSAADSTGRDEVREESRDTMTECQQSSKGQRITLPEVNIKSQSSHKVTQVRGDECLDKTTLADHVMQL